MLSRWSFVFSVSLAVRLICARFSIIPDCDEVFNYWEPTHLLTNGFGLETWEYSPVYAIRSWAYVGLHGLVIKGLKLVLPEKEGNDAVLFYGLRAVFAIVSAYSESSLYSSLCRNISKRVGFSYLVLSLVSSGMFHASVSYLPSSFAMYAVTLALANFVDDSVRTTGEGKSSGQLIVRGFSWLAVGGLLGWPFSLVLVLPFGLRFTIKAILGKNQGNSTFFCTALKSLASFAGILAVIVGIDSVAYRKLGVVVPFNIVAYNVFNSNDKTGPEIFGTEPWTYYILNLLINFNGAFILSFLSLLAPLVSRHPNNSASYLLTLISPFFLWLGIFISTPHKEERFIYPVYASLLLNAALGLEVVIVVSSKILSVLGVRWSHRGRLVGTAVVVVITIISLLRSIALGVYYRAPLDVYDHIPYDSNVTTSNICVGREWYRYPSSYFLADNQRLKFVKSGFSGLLPGEFDESKEGGGEFWWNLKGTWTIPPGMNNENLEDSSKYVKISECDYIVDTSSYPVDTEVGEEFYVGDRDHWDIVYCGRFLDSGASTGLGRILMLPGALQGVTKTRLVGHHYCLLKAKKG